MPTPPPDPAEAASPSDGRRRFIDPLTAFLHDEAAGGVVLLVATAIALLWANSPWQDSYFDFWHHTVTIGAGDARVHEDLQHWVNDGLMAIFFFVVGLEIKRELVVGELRAPRAAALPAVAAVGGMVVPALCWLAFNGGTDAAKGWGIPMATDIAFAIGVLALLGPRIPASLKLLLLTIAIVDDIGAILVIAVVYSDGIEMGWLLAAVACVAVALALRLGGLWAPLLYVIPAFVLWLCVFESGVHATIAGVVLAFLVPARPRAGADEEPPAVRLQHAFHPLASFLVIPLFALANAGVVLSADALRDAASSRITWGVIVALVVGKSAGISAASALAVRTGAGRLAPDLRASLVVGISALGGIGFTVSLFIAELAFSGSPSLDQAKIGILVSSAVAAALGASVLRRATAS